MQAAPSDAWERALDAATLSKDRDAYAAFRAAKNKRAPNRSHK